ALPISESSLLFRALNLAGVFTFVVEDLVAIIIRAVSLSTLDSLVLTVFDSLKAFLLLLLRLINLLAGLLEVLVDLLVGLVKLVLHLLNFFIRCSVLLDLVDLLLELFGVLLASALFGGVQATTSNLKAILGGLVEFVNLCVDLLKLFLVACFFGLIALFFELRPLLLGFFLSLLLGLFCRSLLGFASLFALLVDLLTSTLFSLYVSLGIGVDHANLLRSSVVASLQVVLVALQPVKVEVKVNRAGLQVLTRQTTTVGVRDVVLNSLDSAFAQLVVNPL